MSTLTAPRPAQRVPAAFVGLAAAACILAGLTGWIAVSADRRLTAVVALLLLALLVIAGLWRLEGLVAVLILASVLPGPSVVVGTASFPPATVTIPLILAAGLWVIRRRGMPVSIPFAAVYLALLGVAVLSLATSWVLWDARVPTGLERGYGHRWIGYQLTALYLLAFPFMAFAAGVVVSRLVRLQRLYGWILAALLGLTLVLVGTWLLHPLNPLDAFAQRDRPKADNQWAAYLLITATALIVTARRSILRLVALVLLVVSLAATLVSYVLSSWLGALAAVTVIVWHRFRTRGLVLWLGLLAAGGLATQTAVEAIVQQRAASPDVDRLKLWESGITVWTKSPLVGVGPGNFASYMETYSAFPLGLVLQGYQQAHNMFIELLAELGVLGFALLAVFLFLVVRTLVRATGGTATEAFGVSAALGLLAGSATIAAFGSGFIPTIASAGYNALPDVSIVWFVAGCGVGLAQARIPRQSARLEHPLRVPERWAAPT